MKNFIIVFVLLMISSPLFSEEIFFECTLNDPERFGSYMNISYDQEDNSGSIVSDLMGNAISGSMLFKTTKITKTSDGVFFYINLPIVDQTLIANIKDGKDSAVFVLNRSTLELTGRRQGQCKIIEKKNKF